MRKSLLSFLLIPTLVLTAFSQNLNKYKNLAREADSAGSHMEAISYSESVLEAEPDNFEFQFIYAKAAISLGAYQKGERNLQMLKNNGQLENFPLIDYYLGLSAHRQGKYRQALKYYGAVSPTVWPEKDDLISECRRDAHFAETKMEPSYSERKKLNSTPHSDFVSEVADNQLFFVSVVAETDSSDCGCTTFNGCWDRLELSSINLSNPQSTVEIMPVEDVSMVSHSGDGKSRYVAQCICKKGSYECKIYYQFRYSNDQEWEEPIELPDPINVEGTRSTQPFLAKDIQTGNDLLYFVSDRNEGMGLDIFRSSLYWNGSEVEISQVESVAQINSEADEVTPFFHEQSKTLYFSSNRTESMGNGDFDIYSYSFSNEEDYCLGTAADTIIQLPQPLNSHNDDLYYRMNDYGDKAYFSSNHHGSMEVCEDGFMSKCLDIYEVTMPIPDSLGTILVDVLCECPSNEIPDVSLLGATNVQLIDNNGVAYSPEYISDDLSNYTFSNLPIRNEYKAIILDGPNFKGDTSEWVGPIICPNDTLPPITLMIQPDVEWRIFTKERYIERHYNAGAIALYKDDERIDVIDLVPGEAYYSVSVDPCSEYKVSLIPANFDTILCGEILDPTAFGTERAIKIETCSQISPVLDTFYFEFSNNNSPLYFDHAIPARGDQTKSYDELYNDYVGNRGSFYGQCDLNDPETVDAFFDFEVSRNFQLLQNFSRYINSCFEYDPNIKVFIGMSGFASQAGRGTYNNDALSQRRMTTVNNFLRKHAGFGYANNIDFTEEPNGDAGSKGAKNSDCGRYGVNQSRDRRVSFSSYCIETAFNRCN